MTSESTALVGDGATLGSTFVDTNILVYAHDASEAVKQPIARERLERLWADGAGTLSTQILQEFYVVATRKLASPMSPMEAREIVGLYSVWPLVIIDSPLILNASRLEEDHQLSFWDALVLEASRVAGAELLLTEDMQHGRVIEGVRIENPFRGAWIPC
jgi:predicted nucleic acid-binding protein